MPEFALSYSRLDPAPVRVTIERLHARIAERFPDSSLSRLAAELTRVARENEILVVQLRRPIWWLRACIALALVLLIGLAAGMGVSVVRITGGRTGNLSDVLQAVDATLNELIFLSLAVFFLTTLETRFRRRVALRMLHRFRSLAHIVDMHQLTKDPEHALRTLGTTTSSPARQLSRGELARYLEYCSELLALVSKLAALHAQDLQDAVVLEAVNDVESLTADLSRKVWQKITILDVTGSMAEQQPPA